MYGQKVFFLDLYAHEAPPAGLYSLLGRRGGRGGVGVFVEHLRLDEGAGGGDRRQEEEEGEGAGLGEEGE